MENVTHPQKSNALSPLTAALVIVVVTATLSLGHVLTNRSTAQEDTEDSEQAISSIPFGGRIEEVIPCTCSGGWLITVGEPVPAEDIVVQEGVTDINMHYQHNRTGPWSLGLWTPFGICEVYAGKSCIEIEAEGTVITIGTSH